MLTTFPTIDEQISTATAVLQSRFSTNTDDIAHIFVPYRISPLGAHIDHQGGHVLGRTLNTGTVLAFSPSKTEEIELVSVNFGGTARFKLGDKLQKGHWAQYAQAAALALQRYRPLQFGLIGAVSGTMIGAGLSSSASVGLAYLLALATVNGIDLAPEILVELDRQLENDYMGLQNGLLDQSSIVYGHTNALVYIDTRQRIIRHIPDPTSIKNSCWLIAFSGVSRALISSDYNNRVQECHAAAKWLDPTARKLSDVEYTQFLDVAPAMPEKLRRRTTHFFGETERVALGTQAWKKGDFAQFGCLMNASCKSSIELYQCGHQAVIDLHRIVADAPGVYGNRFSGGGYGGCIIALTAADQAEAAAELILTSYRQQWPELADKAAVYRANAAAQWQIFQQELA